MATQSFAIIKGMFGCSEWGLDQEGNKTFGNYSILGIIKSLVVESILILKVLRSLLKCSLSPYEWIN